MSMIMKFIQIIILSLLFSSGVLSFQFKPWQEVICNYRKLREFQSLEIVEIVHNPEDDRLISQIIQSSTQCQNGIQIRFANQPECIENIAEKMLIIDFTLNHSDILLNTDLGTHCRWLFHYSDDNFEAMKIKKPAYNSYVYTWIENSDDNSLQFNETYSVKPDMKLLVNELAIIKEGLIIKENPFNIWRRRKDLGGIEIRFSVVNYRPALVLPPGGDLKKGEGVMVDLINDLAKQFNIVPKLNFPKKGSTGFLYPNGTWDGTIGDLVENRADIAPALHFTALRSKFVDFVNTIDYTEISLVVRREPYAIKFSFLNMLKVPVWILGFSFVFIYLVYPLFTARKFLQSNHLTVEMWSGVLIYGFGPLVNQSTEVHHYKRTSLRILLINGLFFGFLAINILAANLTSSISVRKEDNLINNLNDIYTNSYKLFILGGTSIEQDFITADKGTAENLLWESQLKKNPAQRPPSIRYLFGSFLQTEHSAMVVFRDAVKEYTLLNRKIGCGLREIRFSSGKLPITMGVRKNFAYFKAFNGFFTRMTELGLIDNLRKKWVTNVEREPEYICAPFIPEPEVSIGWEGTKWFFYLVFAGIVLSLVLVIMEKLTPYAISDSLSSARPFNRELPLRGQIMEKTDFQSIEDNQNRLIIRKSRTTTNIS